MPLRKNNQPFFDQVELMFFSISNLNVYSEIYCFLTMYQLPDRLTSI